MSNSSVAAGNGTDAGLLGGLHLYSQPAVIYELLDARQVSCWPGLWVGLD